jgi:hypothetical protein
VTCQDPYVCPEELTTVPTSLMACSSPESAERFFGKNPVVRYGQETYFEFLQSISDAPFLVRDDEPRSTRAFIDSQTTYVNCLMIAYSPQYGIVSTINIMAELEADVRVDYEIQHYQSLEGDDFKSYRIVVIFAFVLSMIVLIEKIITMKYSTKDYHMRSFCFDMIIQVILPLIYYSIRFTNISNSKKLILKTIGVEGLAGVPWSSRTVDLEEKIEAFFTSLHKLDQLNATEKIMSIFYFVLCSLQLLRLIFQTSAHPRTAILIDTLCPNYKSTQLWLNLCTFSTLLTLEAICRLKSLDDLWHFFILLIIVLGGFVSVGSSQFADTRKEFQTIEKSEDSKSIGRDYT